jgi:hypothetical protein
MSLPMARPRIERVILVRILTFDRIRLRIICAVPRNRATLKLCSLVQLVDTTMQLKQLSPLT